MSSDKEKTLRKAERYALRGNIPAAINQFRNVVQEDPDDLISANTLGDLYVRAGEIRGAILHFTHIADRYRKSGFTLKAIGVLKKIARLDETNVEAAMELADLYCERGLLVEARRQYLQIAEVAERAGRQQQVREAFQKIAEMEPANTTALLKLAELCGRDGLLEEARDWFLRAGEQFARKDDPDQAMDASLKALELCPDSRPAILAVVTSYKEKGELDLAVETLTKALERNEGDIELKLMLGRTYLTADSPHDAARVFESLIYLNPEACMDLIEVSRRFLERGDLDEVTRLVDTHLDALIKNEQESKAVDLLQLILARAEGHLGAQKMLAQIFKRTNQDDRLVATLTTLAETAAEQGAEQEAMEALDELEELTLRSDASADTNNKHTILGDSWEFSESSETTEPVAEDDPEWEGVEVSDAEVRVHEGFTDLANENVLIHVALKELYQQLGSISDAATKCVELARIHEARGESSRATNYLAEADRLTRSARSTTPGEPRPNEGDLSRSGIIVPQDDVWDSEEKNVSLQLAPVEYNLSHYLKDCLKSIAVPPSGGTADRNVLPPSAGGTTILFTQSLRQLTREESLAAAALGSGELEISSDAIAEVDERFQACSGQNASAGEIYEAYRLAIGSLTKASQHIRAKTDKKVHQKLSRAYLTVVEAFSSLLCLTEGFDYQGILDTAFPRRLSVPLSQLQRIDLARALRSSAVGVGPAEHWANRRKVERYPQRLPVLVTANSGNWRELTESLDVSVLGLRFRLSHPVEPGTALRIQLAMPGHLRLHGSEGEMYYVRAVVCHQVEDTSGSRLVGAEFGSVLEGQPDQTELTTANGSFCEPYPSKIHVPHDLLLRESEPAVLEAR